MFDLDKLWKKRLRVILQSIAAGERSHREIASIASHIGADYHGRFLIELLQNACDQAKKVGLRNSCVTIVRTEHFIAVTNQGEPFTEPGIEEITSLGLSSKDPQVDIGNKGFGFKAVFQITEEPEIYSSLRYGDSFRATGSSHFGLNRRVFQTEFFRERVSTFVEESLRRIPDLADEIRATTGCDDVRGAILAEVAQAAPFKFPVPLGAEHLNRRLDEVQLPPGREADSETLIVLPLLSGEETARVVNDAFVDLYQTNAPAVLFLDGVGRVEVVDRVRGVNTELLREMVSQAEELERGAKFQSWRTWTTELEGDARSTDWWVAFRDIGASDENEQAAVAKAAAELPGENWHHVRHARVAVALPHPSEDQPVGTPLDPNGLFCIGLPTADRTGTPFWIDGRFHANISRTGIDLTKSYNRLLFDEAVKLVVGLVERLKIDAKVNSRRAVTQAMTFGNGHLENALRLCGLPQGKIILAQDGLTFLAPTELGLPESSDMEMYHALARGHVGNFEFVLAESSLMSHARELLDQLSRRPKFVIGPDQRFLRRPDGRQSLLEFGTSRSRAAGPRFWEPFFEWISRRFTAESLKDQKILPVGDGALVSPGSRVFFQPGARAGTSSQSEEDVGSEEIPSDLANALLFLDERALPVRDSSGGNLTPLARRLAIDGGTQSGLIRRPRRLELLNDLIAPRLLEAADRSEQRSTALDILRLAVKWSQALSDSARAQLRTSAFRVPVKSPEGAWSWVTPRGVYFGDNWLDPETNQLLNAAYGGNAARRLVEWSEFAAASSSSQGERSFWINGLSCLEVDRAPRVRKASKNRPAPLCSWAYSELSPVYGAAPPWPELALLYQDYIEAIRKRTANTKSGQMFDVKDLTWVDGLENDDRRPAVVELMLRNPAQYEPYTETLLQRSDGGDAKQVLSFWAHCLKTKEWPVVPTERGYRPTTKCWLLEREQATKFRKRYSYLDCLPSRFWEAQRLLRHLGAQWLNDAPAQSLVEALHTVADALREVRGSQQKSIEALAEDLYARLNRRGAARLRAESFLQILTRPVPLRRGDRLVAGEVARLDCLYFDDDPNRSRFIPDFSSHLCVPVAIRSGFVDLLAAFRDVLGETHVVRTSEAPIDTGFTPETDPPEELFAEYIKRQFPDIPVMVDLGLVMVLAGRDPSTDDFKRVWTRLTDAVLRFGHFPAESRTVVFCEGAELVSPTVLTSVLASKYQLLEAVWPILGSAARYILAAYAAAVQTNGLDTFFADKGFGSVERENMESALGMAAPGPFEHLRSAIFAVWRRHNPSEAIEQFHDLWKARSRKSEDVVDWTQCFGLQDVLDDPKATDVEGQNLEVLRAAAVSIPEWQQARHELDDLPWRFEKSIERYSEARNVVTATLMVVAARSATTDLAVAHRVLDELATTGVPESIAHDIMTAEAALRANIDNGAEIVSKQDSEALDILASRIRRLQKEPPASLDAVFFEDIPRREVDTYLERPAPLREQDAREVVSNVLKVASALAAVLGEEFDFQLIQTDDRVMALSSGWWSNRFTVLYALRRSIERIAPKTASRMSEQMIFHSPRSWQTSWSMLPELGPVLTTVPVRPEPKKTLLGQQLTKDEILQDLAKASAGKLGQALSDAAKQAVPPDVFRGHHHAPATPPERRAGGAARPTTGRGRTGQTETDNELTGILGEGFVFEYLKGSLPGFDESCWRSGSRKAYGFADTGRDDLGYDFEYADSHGCLSGRADKPCCYIEVKATTSDGAEAFPITANEWEKAQWCHENPTEALYVIIRIERVTSQAPAVWDILIDPVQLWTKKEIAISHHDLWVYVGRPLHPEPPSAAGA